MSKVENGHRLPSAELARRCDEVLGAAGGLAGLLPGVPAVRRGAVVRPAQLPADVAAFTGRDGPMAELGGLLAGAGRAAVVTVAVITGAPGIGKTALAMHWAHHVAGQFTDGVLYADLRGHDPGAPEQPADVLEGFLRALGAAPAVIPPGVAGRSALLRTLVHGKQMLILLDNAAAPGQVRPLLPGSPGCVAVVTSRSRMSGLVARDGVRRVTISPLTETEAMLLLRRILGPARVDAEPMAAAEIAQRCAGLPLALRIAADRAATRRHLTLASLAGQLAAEHERLDVLTSDGDEAAAVRAVFSWSYTALPADAARMFRVLGLHPGTEISIHAAAALAARGIAPAARLLDVLAGVHLLEETAPDTRPDPETPSLAGVAALPPAATPASEPPASGASPAQASVLPSRRSEVSSFVAGTGETLAIVRRRSRGLRGRGGAQDSGALKDYAEDKRVALIACLAAKARMRAREPVPAWPWARPAGAAGSGDLRLSSLAGTTGCGRRTFPEERGYPPLLPGGR